MKKKFINGLLLAALFVGFTGSMVSCKDYDDEKLGGVIGSLSNLELSLKDALEAQKKALQDQIDALQGQLNDCKKTCADFRALVEKTYLTINEFNTFKDNLGNIYYTKTEVDEKLKNGYYTKEEIDKMFGDVNGKFDGYYTKAEVDQLLEELKGYIDAEAIAKTIADLLAAENKTLTDALNNYFINDPVVVEYLRNGKGADIIKEHITKALIEVNNSISEAKAIADEALKLAKANEIRINGLEESVKTLQGDLITLGNDLDEVRETANAAKAKAEANSLLIENLEVGYDLLEERVSQLENDSATMMGEIEAMKNEIAAMKEQAAADKLAADALHREMLETISGIVSTLDKLGSSIDEINEDIDDIYYYLADLYINMATLGDLTAILKNADVQELLNNAREVLDNIQDVQLLFNKMLTGIEVNGTDNPMFGSFALPVGVRSNVLVAFYGQTDAYGIQFPTNRPAYYANGESGITDEDIEMIGSLSNVEGYINKAGERIIVAKDGAEGNAGTLYLTVNPTNRDFTGTEFELINSQNETSAIVLSGLAKSDKVLNFGYTRAGVNEQSSNGFYEAKATLSQADVNNVEHAGVDINTLKDIVDNIRNYKDINVTNLINDVYSILTDICEAKAVKGTWKDNDGKAYSVVSQYALAATAVRPLSFAFAKDVTYEKIPGLGIIDNIADRFINELVSQFPYLADYEISNIELKTLDLETLEIEVIATVTKNGVTKTADLKCHISKYVDKVDGITYQNVADLIEDLNDFFAQFNTISVDSIAAKVRKSLTSFFDELNNRYGHYFNPNKLMQPVLLIKANNNYARLSAMANYPAHVDKTTLALLPTTYNAEIIAPAYKKFLAVTNVSKDGLSAKGGDAACKSILDEANEQENFMKVIESGFNDFIEFNAKAGYTYEILYSAVDYDGKVAAKKFYVKVNE